MKIVTLPVSDLHPADYNPRKDLAPGDKQYEKLTRSIETFGYVEPIVWNRTTGNIVGGHQRLKVLVQKGYTEVQVVEVELNEQEERILNVSLNKISGRWDNEKLTAILDELKEQGEMALTGFDDWELDALKVTYDHIEDLLNEDFSDTGKSEPNSPPPPPRGGGGGGKPRPRGGRGQGKGAYLMEIIKKRIADMERAEYNPRVELMPGDDEYEKLKRNIDRFGVVVPVIWNKRTNRVVSGHQRLTVLMNEGVTETDVSVVDLDETAEKQLNIAMNKVTGEWDEVKLKGAAGRPRRRGPGDGIRPVRNRGPRKQRGRSRRRRLSRQRAQEHRGDVQHLAQVQCGGPRRPERVHKGQRQRGPCCRHRPED